MKSKVEGLILLGFLVAGFSHPGFGQVNPQRGSFSKSVPIQVPSHRGLEPSLALSYNSSGGNALAGVGWSLAGFSTIERQGPDGGSPRYTATDTYRLGGEELLACAASSSPGCLAGGTHFTKHERYNRIVFDPIADEWTVTSRNGNTATYTPIFVVGASTFRYGLTSVRDTLGTANEVTYNWTCDGALDCYPDSVEYNRYRVKLHWSTRVDPLTFATGASLGRTNWILRTIEVGLDDGTPIRAYKLDHSPSPSTGRSVLDSVQVFGTDVDIDNGVVIGGTSLPAESFTYQQETAFWNHKFKGDPNNPYDACTFGGLGDARGTGDFNGDGKQDIYCHDLGAGESGQIKVSLSTGSGFEPSSVWGTFCVGTGVSLSTGDFNGDGKTDFLCKEGNGFTYVTLSTGAGLGPAENWTGGVYCKAANEGTFLTSDFDGDGKTDIGCHFNVGSTPSFHFEVRLSTGSAPFATATNWLANWCRSTGGSSWGETWGVSPKALIPGDFNGDGNTDLLCRGLAGLPAGPWIAFSNGIGAFTHEGAWSDVACDGTDQRGLGDFNGDGKADLYCYDNTSGGQTLKTYVGLSDGSDFHTGEWLGPLGCQRFSVADMNGDGRNDVWCHQDTSWRTYVGLSNGVDGFDDLAIWAEPWCAANRVIAGDFSGDSKTDIVCTEDGGTSLAYSGSLDGKTDLLMEIDGSLGGTTTVTYVPGTSWPSTIPPPPAQHSSVDGNNVHSSTPSIQPRSPGIPTVSSVTVDDGRGWSATTLYFYQDSLYDAEERVSLGFQWSTVIHPKLANETAGPRTVTQYNMTVAAAGAVIASTNYDGSWNELNAVGNTIQTAGDGKTEPYTAKVTARTSYLFDGSGTDCTAWPCANGERRYQEYEFDPHGNRTEVRDHGNLDATGDEATTVVEFYPNTSAYIVNRPARTISYFGIGVTPDVLSDARTYFDGATSHTSSPTAGLVTKSDVWLDTETRYVPQCSQAECILYDANGNVTKVIDTKGGETTFVYDTTYQKFVTSVTNAESHVTQTPDWDLLCEAPERVIDPNLEESTTSYDALCRHERSDGPAGTGVYSESLYVSLGNPNAQYTETRSPSPDGTGFYWRRTYFDGLGRSYKTESKSGEPGKTVVSGEVTFNPRGLTATAAQPRFASDPPYATSFTYDPRNRVTRQEYADCNPACSAETFLYGLNYSVHTNPDGEYTVTSRDATGLTTYFVEYLSGNPIYTTTIQVPQNHATAVYDNQANMWYTQTDSLGRPIAILDPDSSWETREYYDSNELEATVNMLGERTEFTYDGIGRMLTKTTRAGTPNAQLTNFIYDVFDPSYSNIGTLSRMDDSEGFEVYDYDALGRPKRKRRNLDAQDYTFVFSYNAAGLPSSTLYPDAQTISWTYDAAGNLETETGTITASSYDAAGRLKTRDFTNGIVSTMSYDPARGWIDSIDATDGVSPPVQDLTYEHNRDGTIQSVTSAKPMESWTYTYDDLNRLKTATNVDTPSTLSQTFDYDDIGNITYNDHIGTYTYPAATNPQPHAVATAGSRTYGYNAIGQMTNRNGTIIQWNGDGKPSSIGSVVFAYDGVGGRLKKTSSGQTTRWIGGDYEIAHSGTVTKYLAGGKQVGSDFFVHHRDHLGSIQGVTDATGTEVRRQDHKPFGDQHFVSGSHQESKGWIGEREEETELVYLNARYYDPEIGRFISADPVLTPGQGMNRYTYSLSNPVNFRDPSGMNCGCGPHGDPNGGRHRERQQARMERAQQNREATNFYRISDNREINLAYRRLWDRALNNEELPAEQRGALVTSLLALRGDGVSITFSADGLENWELGVTTYMGTTQLADETHTCSLSVGCAKVSIHIRPGLAGDELAMVLAHEGDHVAKFDAYAADVINKRGADGGENDVTLADMERSAYGVTAAAANALGVETVTVTGRTGREFTIFNNGTIDSTAIDSLVEDLGLDDWTISESIIGRHHPFLPWGT